MSLVLLKPDAIRRKLVGPLIWEFESKFPIIRLEKRRPPQTHWESHYREHVTKEFWPGLLEHMMSGSVIAMLIGYDFVDVREFAVDLRQRYGADKEGPANLIHASTPKDCIYEMDLWFPGQLR